MLCLWEMLGDTLREHRNCPIMKKKLHDSAACQEFQREV